MPARKFFQMPFFADEHRKLACDLEKWTGKEIPQLDEAGDVDGSCRNILRRLAAAGWLKYVVPRRFGGVNDRFDLRSICIIRECLARDSGLADFSFAMQGLGSAPITLFGSEALKSKYLPKVASGEGIAAFAISEAGAGSDVSAMQTTARRADDGYVLEGSKTWISNTGLADFYVVFCQFPEMGKDSFVAAVVDADNPGLKVTDRIETIAPHPLGTISLRNCHVSREAVIGEEGKGLKIAFGVLDIFRATVGAAALGFSQRAMDEALAHVTVRRAFGKTLAQFQLTQARLAEMSTAIDVSALLVYRAAWMYDNGIARVTRESSMAKLYSTEAAQQVVDDSVQLLGALGIVSGTAVERLYREVRALRIYEGTSEIQKLIIAKQILQENTLAQG